MKRTIWKNCYSDSWKGILIEQAFQHPAKISLALAKKIFEHAIVKGWIQKSDCVLDPFAGIGGVAFAAGLNGIRFVGQELEQHFVDMANGVDCNGISKEDWIRFYGRWDQAHKSGRRWCPKCIAQAKEVIEPKVTTKDLFGASESASYVRNSGKIPEIQPHHFEGNLEFWRRRFNLDGAVIVQGDSRMLLENLREQVECVMSSPPFCDGGMGDKRLFGGIANKKNNWNETTGAGGITNYGESPANLGNLPAGNIDAVISSPPYIESLKGNGNGIDFSKIKDGGTNRTPAREAIGVGYGKASGQLAAMPEGSFDLVASSPPYESCDLGGGGGILKRDEKMRNTHHFTIEDGNYTTDKLSGNIGNSTGETFWSAAREIVQQCFLALRPGGHAIWITKRFVRDGQIVEFSQQWAKLCESVGFKLVCWHHALLVDEGATQININGEDEIKKTERKSFFRRLAEKKGSPRIDWEDVICMVKPK